MVVIIRHAEVDFCWSRRSHQKNNGKDALKELNKCLMNI